MDRSRAVVVEPTRDSGQPLKSSCLPLRAPLSLANMLIYYAHKCCKLSRTPDTHNRRIPNRFRSSQFTPISYLRELPRRVTHWKRLRKKYLYRRYVLFELVTVVMDTRYNYHVTDQYPITCDRKAKPDHHLGLDPFAGHSSHVHDRPNYLLSLSHKACFPSSNPLRSYICTPTPKVIHDPHIHDLPEDWQMLDSFASFIDICLVSGLL
jgi:hypothetical protein